MITKYFKIGKTDIRINYPEALMPPANFLLFEVSPRDIDYEYTIEISRTPIIENAESVSGKKIAVREDLRVFRNGKYESRLLGARGREGFYGCYQEVSERCAYIRLDAAYENLFSQDTVFSSLFCLERRALAKGGIVLHCVYLNYQGNAILFSAPSGVGKSTQAALWEKYRGAKTENGDRALIYKEDGKWCAHGWPVCGSSEICSNTSHPIQAIVTLNQWNTNIVTKLSAIQSFSKLYSEVTINSWNREAAAASMNIIEEIVRTVPVYHLSCNISEEAVRTLETVL